MGADELILQVLPTADSDAEELADLAEELQTELLAADVVSVASLTGGAVPDRAKGAGALVGWLAAQFGTLDGLSALVAAVRIGELVLAFLPGDGERRPRAALTLLHILVGWRLLLNLFFCST